MSGHSKYSLFGIIPDCWAAVVVLFYFCYYVNRSQNPKVPLYQLRDSHCPKGFPRH